MTTFIYDQLLSVLNNPYVVDALFLLCAFTGVSFVYELKNFFSTSDFKRKVDEGYYIKTEGEVVGMINASKTFYDDNGMTSVDTGKLLWIEYSTEEGDVYKVKTKEMISGYDFGDRISVFYSSENPSDYKLDFLKKTLDEQIQKSKKLVLIYALVFLSIALYFQFIY